MPTPQLEVEPTTRHVPWPGIQPVTFRLWDNAPTYWGPLAGAMFAILKNKSTTASWNCCCISTFQSQLFQKHYLQFSSPLPLWLTTVTHLTKTAFAEVSAISTGVCVSSSPPASPQHLLHLCSCRFGCPPSSPAPPPLQYPCWSLLPSPASQSSAFFFVPDTRPFSPENRLDSLPHAVPLSWKAFP